MKINTQNSFSKKVIDQYKQQDLNWLQLKTTIIYIQKKEHIYMRELRIKE